MRLLPRFLPLRASAGGLLLLIGLVTVSIGESPPGWRTFRSGRRTAQRWGISVIESGEIPGILSSFHPGRDHAPAAQPVRQRFQLAAGGAEGPGLLLAATGAGVGRHPDGDLDPGLGDARAGDPLHEQRLILRVLHRWLPR